MPFDSTTTDRPARVALLCAVRLYREGLMSVIDSCPEFEVIVSQAPESLTAASLKRQPPDIIVLEAGSVSRDLLSDLREVCSEAAIVAFAVREVPEEILACIEAGASAFVPTDSTAQELVEVLRGVLQGEISCSQRAAGILYRELQRLRYTPVSSRAVGSLSFRERQVFELLCQGLRNQEIADGLDIQLPTVKNHLHRIYKKLQVRSRTEAVSYGTSATVGSR